MTFKPADFSPGGNGQVKWYRLFARSASGNSVKVRLTDTHLPGSGIEVKLFPWYSRVLERPFTNLACAQTLFIGEESTARVSFFYLLPSNQSLRAGYY